MCTPLKCNSSRSLLQLPLWEISTGQHDEDREARQEVDAPAPLILGVVGANPQASRLHEPTNREVLYLQIGKVAARASGPSNA